MGNYYHHNREFITFTMFNRISSIRKTIPITRSILNRLFYNINDFNLNKNNEDKLKQINQDHYISGNIVSKLLQKQKITKLSEEENELLKQHFKIIYLNTVDNIY